MGNVNGNFRFEKTGIDGLQVIYPFIAYDERGFFMKTYEQRVFKEHGIEFDNAEDMVSYSHKGVLRGMHFQTEHSQDKLIRVLHGEIWDVAVDLRKDSQTFGKWEGFYLSEENKAALYIPSGFAHGFLALSDDVLFTYRCGELYYPNVDSGIIWNDSTLQVKWPLDRVEKVLISEKDGKLQTFEQFLKDSGGF